VAARAKEISVRQLEAIKPPTGKSDKRMAVGGADGLTINIKPSGSRSWLFRYTFAEKEQPAIGLGGYSRDTNSLSAMRETARGFNKLIKEGTDPKQYLKEKEQATLFKKHQGVSFGQVSEEWIKLKQGGDWTTATSVTRAKQYMRDYALPVLGNKAVIEIQVEDILKVLKPLWGEKSQTASRLQGYLEAIIAKGLHGARATNQPNPAVWKNNLEFSLKSPDKVHTVKHHPSIGWEQLPKFMKELYSLNKPKGSRPDAQCLAFAALCGTRSSATRLMEWDEVDLKKEVWTVPPTSDKKPKRKSKQSWPIPLSREAIRILEAQPKEKGSTRVFSTLNGGEIYDNALSSLPRAIGFEAVAHGFRSTLQNWAKAHGYSKDERELSLQHKVMTGTEAAYDNEKLIPQRKKLMNRYTLFAMSKVSKK
jgi:integrase